jgi:hypothetical protein
VIGASVERFATMPAQENPGGNALTPFRSRSLNEAIAQIARSATASAAQHYLSHARRRLAWFSEAATRGRDRYMYEDTARLLERYRDSLYTTLIQAVEPALYGVSLETRLDRDEDAAELRLLDAERTEQLVAIASLGQSVRQHTQGLHGLVERRLEWLRRRDAQAASPDLLDPVRPAQAMAEFVWSRSEWLPEGRLLLLKLLEESLTQTLPETLAELNAVLVDAEVPADEAELRPRVEGAPRRRTPEGSVDPAGAQILEWMQRKASSGESTQARMRPRELVDALEGLTRPTPRSEAIDTAVERDPTPVLPRRLRDVVLEHLANQAFAQQLSLHATDRDVIDIVSALFDHIYRDESRSDAARVVLMQLQLPYLKIALVDPSMLHDPRHVTRRFLNRLSEVSLGLRDSRDPLYRDLIDLQAPLTGDFRGDPWMVELALQDLETIAEREQRAAEAIDRSAQQQLAEETQSRLARKVVLYEIKKTLGNRTLPESIQPLVVRGLAPLLMGVYIRFGHRSQPWQELTELTHGLIFCAFPPQPKAMIRLFGALPEDLVDRVRAHLQRWGFTQPEVMHAMRAFERDYYEARRLEYFSHDPSRRRDTPESLEPVTLEGFLEAQARRNGQPPTVEAYLAERRAAIRALPDTVQIGAWFELDRLQPMARRQVRLAVLVPETARLVFVDRAGRRVTERDAERFKQELEGGRARVLGEQPAFDDALTAVADRLQRGDPLWAA